MVTNIAMLISRLTFNSACKGGIYLCFTKTTIIFTLPLLKHYLQRHREMAFTRIFENLLYTILLIK